jgi:hypothetical protein
MIRFYVAHGLVGCFLHRPYPVTMGLAARAVWNTLLLISARSAKTLRGRVPFLM